MNYLSGFYLRFSARQEFDLNNLATYVVLDLLCTACNGDSGFCSPFDPTLSWLSAYTLRTIGIQKEGERGILLFVCFLFFLSLFVYHLFLTTFTLL